MLQDLLYIGNPILRKKSSSIKPSEIKLAKIQLFIKDLEDTLQKLGGAGLAAPQIGKLYRAFAIMLPEKALKYEAVSPKGKIIFEDNKPFVIINPEITPIDKIKIKKPEACLSIPYYAGMIERYPVIKLSGLDKEGKKFTIITEKFFARAIQHEYDHLDGVLWFDRITDPKDIYFTGADEEVEEVEDTKGVEKKDSV